MRIETIIPEQDIKRIEECKEKIKERMEFYFDDIDSASAFSIHEMTKSMRMIENDPVIKLQEKLIEDIYIHTVPKTILVAENEEDQEILKGLTEKHG